LGVSSDKLPDPRTFGRAVAIRALSRIEIDGISNVEAAETYAKELTTLAHQMVDAGIPRDDIADWLETVTLAYRERMAQAAKQRPDKPR